MSCRKTVARWVEGVACHLAVGSRDLVGRRIPAFQARAFSKFPIAGPVLCWFVGCGSNEDIGLGGLAVYRIGVSKKSFLNNKLSGQPSFGNISITHSQPVGRIQEASLFTQSMRVLKTVGFDGDFYPDVYNSLVFFAGTIMDHTLCPSSLIPYTLQGLWY